MDEKNKRPAVPVPEVEASVIGDEDNPADTSGAGGMEEAAPMQDHTAPFDHPFLDMFLQADSVVKVVIIILILASMWSWCIILSKARILWRINRLSLDFEKRFWQARSLGSFFKYVREQKKNHPMSVLFFVAMKEIDDTGEKSEEKLYHRCESLLRMTLGREMALLRQHLDFLASVGSTAPFIGLFGTVWGIMNSFQAIGASKNTSLAVVAPGLSEALFATALGLVVAIPSVLAYNKIGANLRQLEGRLKGFVGELLFCLKRG